VTFRRRLLDLTLSHPLGSVSVRGGRDVGSNKAVFLYMLLSFDCAVQLRRITKAVETRRFVNICNKDVFLYVLSPHNSKLKIVHCTELRTMGVAECFISYNLSGTTNIRVFFYRYN
jgi:hypothetical protein